MIIAPVACVLQQDVGRKNLNNIDVTFLKPFLSRGRPISCHGLFTPLARNLAWSAMFGEAMVRATLPIYRLTVGWPAFGSGPRKSQDTGPPRSTWDSMVSKVYKHQKITPLSTETVQFVLGDRSRNEVVFFAK